MYDLQHNRYKLIQDAVAHACQSVGNTTDLLNHIIHFMYKKIRAHANVLNQEMFLKETADTIKQDKLEQIASLAYTTMVSTDDLRDILKIREMLKEIKNAEVGQMRIYKILNNLFIAYNSNDTTKKD